MFSSDDFTLKVSCTAYASHRPGWSRILLDKKAVYGYLFAFNLWFANAKQVYTYTIPVAQISTTIYNIQSHVRDLSSWFGRSYQGQADINVLYQRRGGFYFAHTSHSIPDIS